MRTLRVLGTRGQAGRGAATAGALALLLVLALPESGAGAPAPSIDITVDATATIGATLPSFCGATSTVIRVRSKDSAWNLQIRSNPATYPNGKAKSGATELTSAFQYSQDNVTFVSVTASYVNIYPASQAATPPGGLDKTLYYQQCVGYLDSPASYTIVLEYLGVLVP